MAFSVGETLTAREISAPQVLSLVCIPSESLHILINLRHMPYVCCSEIVYIVRKLPFCVAGGCQLTTLARTRVGGVSATLACVRAHRDGARGGSAGRLGRWEASWRSVGGSSVCGTPGSDIHVCVVKTIRWNGQRSSWTDSPSGYKPCHRRLCWLTLQRHLSLT